MLYTLLSFGLLWAETPVEPAQKLLENMTLTYSQVQFMKASYKKTQISKLLGSKEKSKGKLEYSKGRFRLEEKGKEKKLLIKNDKSFWSVTGNQVLTGFTTKSVPNVFELMFKDPKVWKKFKVSYIGKPDKYAEIKVLTAGQIPNIKEMILKIHRKKRILVHLEYVDDIKNTVVVAFSGTRFFDKMPKANKFSYKPGKKDKVTRL